MLSVPPKRRRGGSRALYLYPLQVTYVPYPVLALASDGGDTFLTAGGSRLVTGELIYEIIPALSEVLCTICPFNTCL